jgi:ATP synthase protein I
VSTQPDEEDEPPRRGAIRALGHATVGIELAASIIVGLFIGKWLDERFDTQPWFGVVFLLLGIAAGFNNLFRAARRAMKQSREADAKEEAAKADLASKVDEGG